MSPADPSSASTSDPIRAVAEGIPLDRLHDPRVRAVAEAVARAGGRLVVVGGWVRDQLLGRDPKDVDLEVLGLPEAELVRVLSTLGEVTHVGRTFGVFLLQGLPAEITCCPARDFAAAAPRRDLTINSLGWDPRSGELLDPCGGRRDLAEGILRASDPESFVSDPLRGVRVAQFAARFAMRVEPSLCALCADLDLSPIPGERLYEEFRKLWLRAPAPARGLAVLRECGMLHAFPELAALVGVRQDPRWHPEGDVWTHTLLVVDAAATLRTGDESVDLPLLWAAACHDLGKPETTRVERDRVSAHGHEAKGAERTRAWLERLRAPARTTDAVCALVRHHLAPFQLAAEAQPAGPAAYRRLARRLARAGVDLRQLERVARADALGRTTEAARRGEFAAGDRFLARAEALAVAHTPTPDVVQGRDLVARGHVPGPALGALLQRCREVQDETGWDEVDRIVARALDEDVNRS